VADLASLAAAVEPAKVGGSGRNRYFLAAVYQAVTSYPTIQPT